MDETLKKYIDELISEIQSELDEATTSGNVAGYNVPGAFSDGGSKDKKRKKKIATQFGYKIVGNIDEGMFSTLDQIKKDSLDLLDSMNFTKFSNAAFAIGTSLHPSRICGRIL